MSNVLLCMGELAVNPYFVKEACMHLYSIEELCYYVYNNAFLLDDNFVNEKLIEFIKTELNLEKLADQIEEIAGKKGALSNLARILNNEVGYYSENEWSTLIEDIENNL